MSIKDHAISFSLGAVFTSIGVVPGLFFGGSSAGVFLAAAVGSGAVGLAAGLRAGRYDKPLSFLAGVSTGLAAVFYLVTNLNETPPPKAPPAPEQPAPTLQQSAPSRPLSKNETTYTDGNGLVVVIPRHPLGFKVI
jgi:hypothetical protein